MCACVFVCLGMSMTVLMYLCACPYRPMKCFSPEDILATTIVCMYEPYVHACVCVCADDVVSHI